MNFSERIIDEYRDNADKRIALVCRFMVGFMLLVALLNAVGIFKIAPLPLYLTVAISVINFLLPTLFYNILNIKSNKIRYLILGILVFQSGLQYSTLSYHTIIMLVFPIVMSCLYNEKKYVLYTLALSIPMVIISHLVAFYLHIVPDEPLVTLKGTIFYGIMPRVIEMSAVALICYFISKRIETLVTTLASKNNELYKDQETLINSLSEIIENKSENTGKHVKRVAAYTSVLCEYLGYSEEDCWKVSLASMMHDVGKIMVSEKILEKPSSLTDEEFEAMKMHVIYGKKMLETSPGELFALSSKIAYHHHERWDGLGYLKCKGEEIDLNARCVALADVFDALITERPYKKAWSLEEAYEEIVKESGKHFDPKVVEAFIHCFDKFKTISETYKDDEV